MKRILFLMLTCFCSIAAIRAQEKPKVIICAPSRASLIHQKQPVFVINGSRVSKENLDLIVSKRIDSVQVVKTADEEMLKIYGDSAKNGVIKIVYKKEFGLVKLPELLAKFKINKSDKNLPVYLNSTIVSDPEQLIADLSKVNSVEITEHAQSDDKNKRQRVLNIITNGEVTQKGL